MPKRVLCFGDSNTYGTDPKGGRFDENTRWPMRLAKLLGDDYSVIEEGLGGRTCVFDDPVEGGYKSGADYLPPCLMSHNPLDAIAIMLGTNDTKIRFNMTARTISEGVMRLIKLCRLYGANPEGLEPRILIIAPPQVGENVMDTLFADILGRHAYDVSQSFGREYYRMSRLMRCEFLDAGKVVKVSPIDAVHLDSQGHASLAQAVYEKLQQML